MPQDTIHQRFLPSESDRWRQKTALWGLKNEEKCLFPMLFLVLGAHMSGAEFHDSSHFGGDVVPK